jgi:uncharacterized SAM-binding protein YcdF (DUF218 family)
MTEDAQAEGGAHGRPAHRRSPLRRLLRAAGLVVVLTGALFFGGFLYFADVVTSLSAPPDIRADAIVVLTGGSQRLNQAIDLLSRDAGKRLLISGVHPTTTRNQIRRLTESSDKLFRCCVDIGYEALDTVGNAAETVDWIREHNYRRVLVVTNNYHMPRSLLELRRADPVTEFIAYPVINSDLKARNWFADPQTLRVMLSEYVKIIAARVRVIGGFERWPGETKHRAPENASMAG